MPPVQLACDMRCDKPIHCANKSAGNKTHSNHRLLCFLLSEKAWCMSGGSLKFLLTKAQNQICSKKPTFCCLISTRILNECQEKPGKQTLTATWSGTLCKSSGGCNSVAYKKLKKARSGEPHACDTQKRCRRTKNSVAVQLLLHFTSLLCFQ